MTVKFEAGGGVNSIKGTAERIQQAGISCFSKATGDFQTALKRGIASRGSIYVFVSGADLFQISVCNSGFDGRLDFMSLNDFPSKIGGRAR